MNTSSKVFAIACVGTFLPNLDLFSINIALPRIAAEFKGTSLDDLSWVLNAYAISYAALLVFFGRLAEGFRRDRSFVVGIALFSAASAASAMAPGVWELVAFRVVAAAGAALMTPTSLGLLLASFPPEQRGAAVRNWAGVGGFAAALGPMIGGLLVSIDWRLVFVVNASIGAIAVLVALRSLPEVPGHKVAKPSVIAALMVTGGIGFFVFSIIKVNAWGVRSPAISFSAAAAVVLIVLFVLHCRLSKNPLIDPSLFRIRPFAGAATSMVPYSITFGAMLFSIAIWGQSAWGWSALQAGLAIIPGPLMVPVTSTLVTGKLVERFGAASAVVTGIILIVVGFFVWATFVTLTPDTLLIVVGMALNGIGVGLVFPALMGAGTQALPPASFATGSAMINMLRQASIATGVALFVVIIGTPATPEDRLGAFQLGWWIMAAITMVTLVPALTLLIQRTERMAAKKSALTS